MKAGRLPGVRPRHRRRSSRSDRSASRSRPPTTPGRTQSPGASDRIFQPEDCCGFWIDTPDGTIWAPGDSRLIPDHHLRMPTADAMLFDFSDSEWHFGLDGAIDDGERLPATPRCCCTTGAASTPPTSRRSTPTRTRCRTGSKTRNAFRSWRPASPSCCGDCKLIRRPRISVSKTPFAKRSVVLIPSPGTARRTGERVPPCAPA